MNKSKCHYLVLILFFTTSFLFAQSGRIQGYVTDETTGDVLVGANCCAIVNPTNIEEIKKAVLELYFKYKKGELRTNPKCEGSWKYERRHLTEKLAKILDGISE